eukprot:589394-Ditylum_brightwellii.AAC.1
MVEKVVPSTRSDNQKYEKCSDAFKLGEHYVGMSEVKGKERHFVVSDWFLDYENNKLSFTKEFIKPLVPNTPTVIENRMKNNLVQIIKNI